jgi:small GTP-binding protein
MALSTDRSLKIILIGSAGVGKTSLVQSFFDDPFRSDLLPTTVPVMQIAHFSFPEASVSLQIWDTAGQERYQSVSHMFYRDSHVALLCFDHQSFDSIDLWLCQLRATAPLCLVFLVSTKSDLLSEAEHCELRRKTHAKAGEISARLHFATSARTGMGVKEVFSEAAKLHGEVHHATQEPRPLDESSPRQCC